MYKFSKEQEFFKNASEATILMNYIVPRLDYEDGGIGWEFGNFKNYMTDLIGKVLRPCPLFTDKEKGYCLTDPFMKYLMNNNRRNIFAEFFVECLESVIMFNQGHKGQKLKVFSVGYDVYKTQDNVVKILSKHLNMSEGFLGDILIDDIKDKNTLISTLQKNPELFRIMTSFICNLK